VLANCVQCRVTAGCLDGPGVGSNDHAHPHQINVSGTVRGNPGVFCWPAR
jgi:hypothetical protein